MAEFENKIVRRQRNKSKLPRFWTNAAFQQIKLTGKFYQTKMQQKQEGPKQKHLRWSQSVKIHGAQEKPTSPYTTR